VRPGPGRASLEPSIRSPAGPTDVTEQPTPVTDRLSPMLRPRGRVHVPDLDARAFVATVPALLARWRRLSFDERGRAVHPATGRPWEGFRVVGGSHPYPGAVYRLVFRRECAPEPTAPEPFDGQRPTAPTRRVVLVELLADEYTRTRVRVRDDADGGRAEVEIERPELPGAVDLVVELPGLTDAVWLARGRVVGHVRLTTDRLLTEEAGEPQLVATVTHPRARARVEGGLAAAGDGGWTVTAKIEAEGRGLLRPIVWLLTPFLRGHARRGLDAFLATLPEQVADLDRELAAEFGGSPDPQRLAARILEDLFDVVAGSPTPEPDRGPTGTGGSDARAASGPVS
jgi:hypothetical protein